MKAVSEAEDLVSSDTNGGSPSSSGVEGSELMASQATYHQSGESIDNEIIDDDVNITSRTAADSFHSMNTSHGGDPAQLFEYTPPQSNWAEEETRLVEKLRSKMNKIEMSLEEEEPGVDELLVQGGWKIGAGAGEVETKTKARVGKRIRKGYDIVRIGNFDGDIAFFHQRGVTFTDERKQLLLALIPPLREVCEIFEYEPAFITLFWHPESASRFIQQRLLLNIWPVEQKMEERKRLNIHPHSIDSLSHDPYVYAYFYGLLIHKLAHFHDIVHGTRHDFYMNEVRIEFLEGWLSLLEKKAFTIQDDRFLPHNVMRTHRDLLCDTVN